MARRSFALALLPLLALGGCGSSDDGSTGTTARRSAQEPEIVAAAERVVRERVTDRLAASRSRYPDDAQVFPSGEAICRPFSDFQLDCKQSIRDETNPWTGTTSWRATVDPATGGVTIEEHGGRTLSAHLDRRSTCLAAGIDCD